MRTVGIWVSGLLASAIPFIFVGAVVALLACVFDAEGEHALTGRSTASSQGEAATERVLAVAGAPDDVAQRQPRKHAHGDADARRHHHAAPRRSRFHSRGRHRPLEFGFGVCKPLCKPITRHGP